MNKYKVGQVPRCGAMDSEFFSNQDGFEESVNRRAKFIIEAYNHFEEMLNTYSTEYVKQGLGNKENFEKDIIKSMMLKRM